MTSSEGVSAEKNHAIDPYYLSTTRHNLGKYSVSGANTNRVILTLDGIKLSNNHKIRPIDYWGEEYRKYDNGDYEAEDRVYSKKPYIENAKKYIKSCRMFIQAKREKIDYSRSSIPKLEGDPEYRIIKVDDSSLVNIRKILILAKRSGIEILLYDNKQDFLINNKSKAVSYKDYGLELSGVKQRKYRDFTRTRTEWPIYPYLELWYNKPSTKVSDKANKIINDLKYDFHFKDKLSSFGSILHNERSQRNPDRKRQLDTLLSIMGKNKLDSRTFLLTLRDKWT